MLSRVLLFCHFLYLCLTPLFLYLYRFSGPQLKCSRLDTCIYNYQLCFRTCSCRHSHLFQLCTRLGLEYVLKSDKVKISFLAKIHFVVSKKQNKKYIVVVGFISMYTVICLKLRHFIQRIYIYIYTRNMLHWIQNCFKRDTVH